MKLNKLTPILPWWSKIIAKIVISRLPLPHSIWKKIGIFEHGSMDNPSYAYNIFRDHFEQVSQVASLPEKFCSLELGPGESLFSALISRSFGGGQSYISDVANFACDNLELYQNMADYLVQKNLSAPNIKTATSLKEVLEICQSKYLTSGLDSLKSIPANSVDFVWSQAVLEHVKREDFLEVMQEIRRIIKADGICSHKIDLRDHFESSLNNLRFSESIWESPLMANSGFYTNRIQYSQMLKLFEKAGFEVKSTQCRRWDTLPLKRSQLNRQFAHLTDEELCISGFRVILQPK